jgi:hypothetical protein
VNATRTRKRAERLGYKITEIDGAILLEAPKGYSFWDDFHELNSYYDAGSKNEAWEDVFQHLGLAELCTINDCDWCDR